MKEHTRWLRQRAMARKFMRIAMWLVAIFVVSFVINFFHSVTVVKGLGFLALSFSFTFLRVGFVAHIKLYEEFCKTAILPFAQGLQKESPSFAVYVPRLRSVFFAKDFRVLEVGFKHELREKFLAHKRHIAKVARLRRAVAERSRLHQSHAELDSQLIALAIEYGKESAGGKLAFRAMREGKVSEKRRLLQMLGSQESDEKQQNNKAQIFMARYKALSAQGADSRALAAFISAMDTLDMDERVERLKQAIDLQRVANQWKAALPKVSASKPKAPPRPAPNRHINLYTEFVRKVPVRELLAESGLNLNMASELLFRLVKDRVFGGRYKNLEDIHGDIARSFRATYGQNFSPADFEAVLKWLVARKVILKMKGGHTISLSSKTSTGVSEPCRRLIAALVAFDQEYH